jgi:hypothetical protein
MPSAIELQDRGRALREPVKPSTPRASVIAVPTSIAEALQLLRAPVAGAPARIALYAVAFHALSFLLKALLRRAGPASFRASGAARQQRTTQYLMSTLNAACCSYAGFAPGYFEQRPAAVAEAAGGGAPAMQVTPMFERLMGYLLADFAVTNWREYPTDAFHHASALFLSYSVLRYDTGAAVRRLMCQTELSTVFLNAMWFAREYALAPQSRLGRGALRAVPLAFAATFFAVRLVVFPREILLLMGRGDFARIFNPAAQGTIWLVVLLQAYWMRLIVKMATKGN